MTKNVVIPTTDIGRWLYKMCKERNLSWRQASINAGLNHGSISYYVNSGRQPSIPTCYKLAKFFEVSPARVLSMAGHDVFESDLQQVVAMLLSKVEELPDKERDRITQKVIKIITDELNSQKISN